MKHSIVIIVLSFLFVNCAGNYDFEFNPESQIALIYLGAKGGNRILYPNSPKFPQLSISRKKSNDSTYIYITNLEINPISLRYRIGYKGPGFAYDWNDADV